MIAKNQGQGVPPQEGPAGRESLREFISMAAHDLREPLRAIRLGARLLGAEDIPQSEESAAQGARYLRDGTQRLETLIRDIAEYCYEEVREPELRETDLECVFLEATNELAAEMKSSGAKITHDPLPALQGNAASLTAVFRCLLSNACKFHGEAPPVVHVAVSQNAGEWIFAVRDNGIGFDPAYSDRVFRPFERLNGKRYPGSGLGLTLARKAIAQHGGRMWAESSPGNGTAVHFTMPL
ncbi:MAG: ATP-binding protein [Acidobacteriota bacterium]|nr:ATP-binding protein [Acidobacteriota bacterium]